MQSKIEGKIEGKTGVELRWRIGFRRASANEGPETLVAHYVRSDVW